MEECLELEFGTGKIEAAESDRSSESSISESVLNINEGQDQLSSYHETLKGRLGSLQDTLKTLKTQLAEERENWKREMNEVIQYSNNLMSSVPIVTDIAEMDTLNPENLWDYKDYELKMKQYQQALSQHQFESRQNWQRQIAIGQYRRRLLEVENMCNLELLRVQQNVQNLQPLQMMVSDWKEVSEKDAIEMGMGERNLTKNEATNHSESETCEVVMPLDLYTTKLQQEATDMLAITRLSGKSSLPTISAQSSVVWHDDKSPCLSTSTSQSAL